MLCRGSLRARSAAAVPLPDLLRVERAVQFCGTFDVRPGGPFRRNARQRCGSKQLIGLAPFQAALAALERQLARARGQIDIAGPAHQLVGGDGNFSGGRTVGIAGEHEATTFFSAGFSAGEYCATTAANAKAAEPEAEPAEAADA